MYTYTLTNYWVFVNSFLGFLCWNWTNISEFVAQYSVLWIKRKYGGSEGNWTLFFWATTRYTNQCTTEPFYGGQGRTRTCRILLLRQTSIPIPSLGHIGVSDGNRTHTFSLEDWGTNHYTTETLVRKEWIERSSHRPKRRVLPLNYILILYIENSEI